MPLSLRVPASDGEETPADPVSHRRLLCNTGSSKKTRQNNSNGSGSLRRQARPALYGGWGDARTTQSHKVVVPGVLAIVRLRDQAMW